MLHYTARMRRLFRAALLWLIALAIPMQGMAAATMLSCGPGHHRMMTNQSTSASAAHDHAAHGHVAPATAQEDESSQEVGSDSRDAGYVGTSSAKDLNQLTKFKCSACAACCMTTALLPSIVGFALPEKTAIFTSFATVSFAPFLTDGLERPPRHYFV
jgi:hypothetical protein